MKKHNKNKKEGNNCIPGKESTPSHPELEKEYLENYYTILANKIRKPKSQSSNPGDRSAPQVHISKL